MAEDKKSFVLYADQKGLFEGLEDAEAGRLIKHVFQYITDQNPETDDRIVKIAFEPIKSQLKRDLIKWAETRKGRSKAGKISAANRKQKATKATNVKSVQQKSTKSTVNVNANVSVTDINKDVAAPLSEYQLFVDYWLQEFKPGWTFGGQHGKAMKSIITKIHKLCKDTNFEESFALPTFKKMCLNLPEWYQNKDLPVIDSKFNEIITEIKAKKPISSTPVSSPPKPFSKEA